VALSLTMTILHPCINISLAAALLLSSKAIAQTTGTNPVCYVCGGDPTATVNNPDVLIDIPPEFNSEVPQATCQQIYQAGLDNLITVEQCDAILLLVDAQRLCGCSNIVGPAPNSTPTSIPAPAPVPVPVTVGAPVPTEMTPQAVAPTETDPPVDVPTNVETDPPGTLMPNPVNVGVESPTECEGKGKGGKGKGENSGSSKGKGGMKMGKKCKKPKEPKTPKAGKGMDVAGMGKGKGESRRI
jgi:hypothetical protein